MNKYYQGPEGVFYDAKRDNIITLEHTGIRLLDTKTWKDIAPTFDLRAKGVQQQKVAVIMTKETIRLGDL